MFENEKNIHLKFFQDNDMKIQNFITSMIDIENEIIFFCFSTSKKFKMYDFVLPEIFRKTRKRLTQSLVFSVFLYNGKHGD